jgi:hypothetical protein
MEGPEDGMQDAWCYLLNEIDAGHPSNNSDPVALSSGDGVICLQVSDGSPAVTPHL